ncbi:MAG: DUF3849 domain-containing protein [Christensenellales bacterium]
MRRIEPEVQYETGADFFRDTAVSHGLEEALGICGRYLTVQLKTKSAEERQFCRELFTAMTEASAGRADPDKIVYPYPHETAAERMEESYYHISSDRNAECAKCIDEIISKSCYERNHYNLGMAAMVAAHDYGFERVRAVLEYNIHLRASDGRFSRNNKEWASAFDLPDKAFRDTILNAHPILIDGFATHFRKLYQELEAERFALPGALEAGHVVHGYEITRSIWFDNQRGFTIGHNPNAPDPFVCWQFTAENGKRDFYWGRYCGSEKAAENYYIARTLAHMRDEPCREIPNPLAAAEMSAEQNYNMIDGLRNNMAVPKADLTDGQTFDELRELAPETLAGEKPSVLEQIKEAKDAPRSKKEPREKIQKSKDGAER